MASGDFTKGRQLYDGRSFRDGWPHFSVPGVCAAIPPAIILQCIQAAATASSGANLQPWHFVVVTDPQIKRQIRLASEQEEREFYATLAPKEWLDALTPLGTDEQKPFLEIAPCLIAIFVERYGTLPDGRRVKHYYATESVGIATGILITAIHNAGLLR